jgi:hypothetical protein
MTPHTVTPCGGFFFSETPVKAIPPLSVDLIRELAHLYPLRNPNSGEDVRAIERRAGQRDVVERLLTMLDQGAANPLPATKLLGG